MGVVTRQFKPCPVETAGFDPQQISCMAVHGGRWAIVLDDARLSVFEERPVGPSLGSATATFDGTGAVSLQLSQSA